MNARLQETVHSILDQIEDDTLRARATEQALKEVAQYDDKATGYFQVFARYLRGELLADEESQPPSPPEPTSSLDSTLLQQHPSQNQSPHSIKQLQQLYPRICKLTQSNSYNNIYPRICKLTRSNSYNNTHPRTNTSLDQTSATTLPSELAKFANTIDTTGPYRTETTSSGTLKFIIMTPEQLREKALREASMDNHHREAWRKPWSVDPYRNW